MGPHDIQEARETDEQVIGDILEDDFSERERALQEKFVLIGRLKQFTK